MSIDYKRIFTYVGIESFVYQILLSAHQVALYRFLEPALYGTIGASFSWLYTAVPLFGMAIDQHIALFFTKALHNRATFSRVIILHSIMTVAVAALLLLLIGASGYAPAYLQQIWPLFMLAVVAELAKRIIKTANYCLLRYRFVACTELAHIVLYGLLVWGSVAQGVPASLKLCLIPLIGASIVQSIVLFPALYRAYASISQSTTAAEYGSLLQQRLQLYVYQVSHLIYSPNMLVPLVAHRYGMPLAGTVKLCSMIGHGINTIIRHMFNSLCIGAFGAISTAQKEQEQALRRVSFAHIHRFFKLCLAAVAVYLLFLSVHSYGTGIIPILTLLIICEHITIVYEQFGIFEGKVVKLLTINGITLIPLFFLYQLYPLSLIELMLALIATKCLGHVATIWYIKRLMQEPVANYR